MRVPAVATSVVLLMGFASFAGEADVLDVRVEREAGGHYRFEVLVRHDDEGWEHYADRWEVVGGDGRILATRILRHPHVHEQPFRRSLGGVDLPAHTTAVTIRAHDRVHGYGGTERRITLPPSPPARTSGDADHEREGEKGPK